MPSFTEVAETTGIAIDGAGVLVIVIAVIFAAATFLRTGCKEPGGFRRLRHDLGRGILLGLELLVAADIIRTVAVTPSLEGVGILGIIVLIRTFLSMSIQIELEGRWPWQAGRNNEEKAARR